MPSISESATYIYQYCQFRQLFKASRLRKAQYVGRGFHQSARAHSPQSSTAARKKDEPEEQVKETEQGAMSRRFEEMTNETIESSGRRASKVIEEAGFSEELKKRLEARILDNQFRSENATAFATANLPVRFPSRSRA